MRAAIHVQNFTSSERGVGQKQNCVDDFFDLTDPGCENCERREGGALVQIATGADAGFSFEIQGSEGWLRLTGSHPFGFQAGDLKLMSNIPFATPDEPAVSGGFMGAAINVGELYAHLVRDLQTGTYDTPGFEHALHNARLIEAVRRAAERGERQPLREQIKSFDEARAMSVG